MKSCRLAVLSLVSLITFGVSMPPPVEAGEPASGFDLRPALNEALIREFAAAETDCDSAGPGLAVSSVMSVGVRAGSGSGESGRPVPSNEWLVGGFDTTSRWVSLGLLVGLGGFWATADTDDVRDLGDVTQIIPLAAALGFTLAARDRQGLRQLGLAGGTAFALTHGIKEVVDKTRPDDSANNSFPSGHTSASVSGAAFIWRRYGPKWGAPASVFAAYTGFSRVRGERHFMDDVISGAAVGLISNWLWTDPIDERVQMALFPTDGGAGINVTIDPTAPRSVYEGGETYGVVPTRLFIWEIGGSDVTRNRVIAPNPGGTPIDFRFDEENDPTTTAFVAVSWSDAEGRYDLYGGFGPFEIREVVEIEEDLDFAGITVPAGTTVQTRYMAYDYRAGFRWAVVRKPSYRILLGAAAEFFYTEVGMSEEDGISVSRSMTEFRPVVHASATVSLGPRWLALCGLHWWSDSDVTIADGSVQIGFRLHPKWTLTTGYRRVERSIKQSSLYTTVDRNQLALGVIYAW